MAPYSTSSNGSQDQSALWQEFEYNFQIPTTLEQRPASFSYGDLSSDTASSFVITPDGSPQRELQTQGRAERASKRRRCPAQQSQEAGSPSFFSVFSVDPTVASNEFVGAPSMATIDFQSDGSGPVRDIDHGPTELPPRPYVGGKDAVSPFKPRTQAPTVPGSALDKLAKVDERITRLEQAVQNVMIIRGQEALARSLVPGLDEDEDEELNN